MARIQGYNAPTHCWTGKRLRFWSCYPNRHCFKFGCIHTDECENGIFSQEQSLRGMTWIEAYKKYGNQGPDPYTYWDKANSEGGR